MTLGGNGRRNTDAWLHRKRRLGNILLPGLAAIVIGLALFMAASALIDGANTRKNIIRLVCDQNRILTTFIQAPPDLPRDKPALHDLRRERCDKLKKGAGIEDPSN